MSRQAEGYKAKAGEREGNPRRVKTREYIMAVARSGMQNLNIPKTTYSPKVAKDANFGAARPGMQKLNMTQKTASPKAAIAANLGAASRDSGVSYGIFAQRTLTGTGLHLNNKAFNSASIGATRNALNDNRTVLLNNIGVVPHKCNHNDGSNQMNKYMQTMLMMKMFDNVLAKVGQTADAFKSTKSTDTDGAGKTPAKDTASSVKPKSLTAMSEAKDSSTLRGAIEAAEADKANMQSRLTELQSKLPDMKKASEAAQKKLAELQPKIEAKEAEVQKKETEVSNGKKLLDNAEQRLRGAESSFDTACTNLETSQKGLQRAQSQLNAAKANIDPNTNKPAEPAYTNALNAVKAAEDDVRAKEQAKEKCAKELAEAQKDQNTAATRYDELQKSYTQAKDELTKMQSELAELKKEESQATKAVDDYNNAIKEEKQLTADIASLTAEIPTQQARLTKLEQEEQNGLTSAASTILDLDGKIAGADGKIDTDDDKTLKGKDEENYDAAVELRRNTNYTKLYGTAGQTIGGKTFRTGSYDGETLYMIGAKKVDAGTYLGELNKARGLGSGLNIANGQIAFDGRPQQPNGGGAVSDGGQIPDFMRAPSWINPS